MLQKQDPIKWRAPINIENCTGCENYCFVYIICYTPSLKGRTIALSMYKTVRGFEAEEIRAL